MSHATLTPIRFENALWEAHLATESEPRVIATLHGHPIPDVDISPVDKGWLIQISVPPTVISDGVHTIVVHDATTQQKLGAFTIVAGDPAADTLLAEVSLLRAELDMLKQAFRRTHAPQDQD